MHLQFPEGLLHYACMIADILKNFTGCEFVISGDVTYGACCIDDFTAQAVGAEFIIHYGTLEIISSQLSGTDKRDEDEGVVCFRGHSDRYGPFHSELRDKFRGTESYKTVLANSLRIYLLSTIQFNASVFKAKETLEMKGFKILVPQEKPRCAGEVTPPLLFKTLGCTSPVLDLKTSDTVLYLCDGRFHMEGVMIANPSHVYYQYNPYTKLMTVERYDFDLMIKVRSEELSRCQIRPDTTVGVVMGVLGRQGSTHIVDRIISELKAKNVKFVTLLVSELSVEQLRCFGE